MRTLLAAVWVLAIGLTVTAQPDRPGVMTELVRARKMSMAFHVYAQEHDGSLPPDMATLAPYLSGDLSNAGPSERAAAVREAFMSAADGVKVPDGADGAWVNAHASFAYLGGAGIKIEDLGDWGRLAVMHLKLDRGLAAERSEHNPEGLLFPVAFVDGHVESLTRAEAESIIKESAAIFEAIKSGGPLPDAQQSQWNVRMIVGAIRAYAKAHRGELPPDLGSTLAFIPADSKRTATAGQRASLYLSPAARKNTHVPDEPTAEWVNQRTGYVYLGGAGVRMEAIEDTGSTILVHSRLDDPIEFRGRAGMERGLALGGAAGWGQVEELDYARWIVDVSRRVMDSARTGAPLPDHVNAFRDARLISLGIASYVKDHAGKLPPDLGAVLPYVLPERPDADRACIFLSPSRERSTGLPERITSEWVKRYCSYTYLGGEGIDLKLAREAGVQVLFHGPMDEPYATRVPYGETSVIASGTSYLHPWLNPVDETARHARESRETLDAMKAAAK